MNNYRAGIFAECIACIYLIFHGFRILRRRYKTGRYTNRAEIDIIAKRKNLMVFIEVKHRHDVTTGLNAVTGAQAARLRRAAETYIAQTGWMGDARFDIMVVTNCNIRWIQGGV